MVLHVTCTKKIRDSDGKPKGKTNEDLSCDVIQLEIAWKKARVMTPR